MDSLTQIVLGAGVGELVLGRKLGNRAMTWGALAGTIPDLDVISNIWLDPAQSLHAHRGFSHSILFALLMPFFLSWITTKLYAIDPHIRSRKWYSFFGISARYFLIAIVGAIMTGLTAFFATSSFTKYGTFIVIIILVVVYGVLVWRTYASNDVDSRIVTYKEWYWFFFWTIFTHPILDCFTVYGTQLFMPFADTRVSWDNISVADPAYTLLYGIPLVLATFYSRDTKWRSALSIIGLVISTGYMMLTFVHKSKVNKVFENTLTDKGVKYEKYMTNPTILNNILWSGTAMTKDSFYTGQYSLWDKKPEFKLIAIAKNHNYLSDALPSDYDVNTVKWFSKDYYSVIRRADGQLQMNDMRYGLMRMQDTTENGYIFKFVIAKNDKGMYKIDRNSQQPPDVDPKELIYSLFDRIRGI